MKTHRNFRVGNAKELLQFALLYRVELVRVQIDIGNRIGRHRAVCCREQRVVLLVERVELCGWDEIVRARAKCEWERIDSSRVWGTYVKRMVGKELYMKAHEAMGMKQ
jgi:hypothetical protein